jgi:5-methylcytosine-specific restriction endonuclease McrA
MSWCRECDKPNRALTAARRRKAGVVPIAKRVLERLWVKQGGRCGICTFPLVSIALSETDHKKPIAKGGRHEESNLQLAHKVCNRLKSSK